LCCDNLSDEIKKYQLGRYISSSEAMWRINNYLYPLVQRLSIHLAHQQTVFALINLTILIF
jgi:hypothetical protein